MKINLGAGESSKEKVDANRYFGSLLKKSQEIQKWENSFALKSASFSPDPVKWQVTSKLKQVLSTLWKYFRNQLVRTCLWVIQNYHLEDNDFYFVSSGYWISRHSVLLHWKLFPVFSLSFPHLSSAFQPFSKQRMPPSAFVICIY